MNTTSIILIFVAFILGAGLAYFMKKGKPNHEIDEAMNKLKSENEQLVQKIEVQKNELIQKIHSANEETVMKAAELKQKYEKLLNEANDQCQVLDKKLKIAMEGKIDESVKEQLEEAEKVKKKLKNLEDEIEEIEDERDSFKKKYNVQKGEMDVLQEQFDKISREKKIAQEELNTAQKELQNTMDELKEKMKEIDLKKDSLSFIQEILTAKISSDKSIIGLYNTIDGIIDFVSTELKDAVCRIYELSKEAQDFLFGKGLQVWAITQKKKWIQGKTTVAFVGEFSAGKTSIVNRILSQDNPNIPLLPVSTEATTAIPTYISGGVGTFYQFTTPNNELKSISEATFKKVSKQVLDQVKGVSSLIQYFVMTYKNPNLDRLSILDTPGFNSSDKEDAERTIGVINECDALFWVVDVNTGTVNRSSLKLIKEHLEKPLYVVINKVDTKAKSEVDKVENLVRQTFNNEGLQVEGFIRFSSKAPLSNIMLPIKSIKPDTNKENYLNQLIQVVEEWTKEQQKDVEKSKRTANELTTQSNDLKGQFEKAINNLCGFAQEAASIPHFENHLFRKDGFELTQEENNRLGYLLKDRISTYSPKYLRNLYRDQMEVRSNLEKAWQEYAEEKAQWQSLNECNETLKRRIKELKKY